DPLPIDAQRVVRSVRIVEPGARDMSIKRHADVVIVGGIPGFSHIGDDGSPASSNRVAEMTEMLERRERLRISRIDQVIAAGHRAAKKRLDALSPNRCALLENDVIDAPLGLEKDR